MSSSSRSKHRSKRSSSSSSSSSYYPTQWSNWEWDEKQGDWKRYRLKAPDQYEFEYESTAAAADPKEPRTPQASLDPIAEGSYSASANYALSSGPSAEAITRGLAQTSLDPGITSVPPPRNQTPAGATEQTHITTINPHTDKEEFDPHYKVHKTFEFKQGRVFKVLWSEPQGTGGGRGDGSSNPETYTEGVNKFGEPSFQKVRRFVIIRPLAGHCICLPINTYSRQGVTKNGVHAGDHTIAYSGSKPVYFKGEKAKGLTKKPLKIVTKNPRHKLADTSRLNYAKTYTVEYNVKVWFIGNVDKDSMWHLITDFNQVHPPLGTQGLSEPSPFQDGEISYADGGMEEQPTPYVSPIQKYEQPTSNVRPNLYSSSKPSWSSSSRGHEQQMWPQQQQYYPDSTSYEKPQPTYGPSTERYPSSHSSSSTSDRRPSRSRGKGKGPQRDDRPEEDIPEGPEEQESAYDKSAYEDAAEPEYEPQYDAYNEERHEYEDRHAAHKYESSAPAEHHTVEEPIQEPRHHDTADYDSHAAYDYPAAEYPAAAETHEQHDYHEEYTPHTETHEEVYAEPAVAHDEVYHEEGYHAEDYHSQSHNEEDHYHEEAEHRGAK